MLFIKTRQNHIYQELMLKLDSSSTEAVSIENYKTIISRFDYTHIQVYLCRVYFLTTLDIYKDYFKGRHTCIVWSDAKSGLVHYSLCRSYCVFTPRVLWPRSFMIFIVDELKNFAANIFFKLASYSRTGIRASLVSHVLWFVHWTERLLLQYKSN